MVKTPSANEQIKYHANTFSFRRTVFESYNYIQIYRINLIEQPYKHIDISQNKRNLF